MKARPILFSAPMVRALLHGRKTQTRRLVKPQPVVGTYECWSWSPHRAQGLHHGQGGSLRDLAETLPTYSPYGVPGDLLWVKETWQAQEAFDNLSPTEIGRAFEEEHGEPWCPIRYLADGKCEGSFDQWQESPVGKTRVSIHMPRWASRLTLAITDVRVERLLDCSDDDARAEGLQWIAPGYYSVAPGLACIGSDPRQVYFELWDHINGAGSAAANPCVWALTFTVHHKNVDEVPG